MPNIIKKLYYPSTSDESTSRDPFTDNLKVILIFFVILGHFLLHMKSIDKFQYLNNFIYLFHMPSFIFITGYYSKKIYQDHKFRVSKITGLFWIFILFQISYFTLANSYGLVDRFELLKVATAPWYLLSMCTWYLLIPILARYKARYMIPLSFIIGILAGMDPTIGTFLSFARTLSFFPFFTMGYYMSSKSLKKLMNKKLRLPAFLIFFGSFAAVLRYGKLIQPYIKIVYGGASYALVFGENKSIGPWIRLSWYLIAILLSLCLFYLTPRCKLCFSYIGQRTLSIYVLHVMIRNYLVYSKLLFVLNDYPKYVSLIIFPFCIFLVWFLSLSIFDRLFQFLLRHPFIFGKDR